MASKITVRRRPTLPVLPTPVCPAATIVRGVASYDGAIICGVHANENARADGLGMSAGQLGIARDGGAGEVLTQKSDPTVVERLCCGAELPVLDDGGHYRSSDGGTRQAYTFCPSWQAEKMRIEMDRDQLKGGGLLPDASITDEADYEAVEGRFFEDTE